MNHQGSSNLSLRIGETLILRQRANSLNFLRLSLALLVIFSHSFPIGRFGDERILGNQTLGDVAVDGFFAISGFLICASAMRHTARFGLRRGLAKYFCDRVLRILPAFWICLIVTATIFGATGWWLVHHGLGGYWSAPAGPLHYVISNSYLRMNEVTISGTPANNPYLKVWDGSLWTLQWEFLCYLGLAVLAALGLLVRRKVVVGIAILLWLGEAIMFFEPSLLSRTQDALRFGSIFVAGVLMYLYRDRIPDSGILAGTFVVVAAFGMGIGHPLSQVSDWITGPALVYPVLWLGAHLPFRNVGATNDLSYGVYIYAFPVGQLLAIEDFQRHGYLLFVLATIAGTLPLAAASWWGIERWALKAREWINFREKEGP